MLYRNTNIKTTYLSWTTDYTECRDFQPDPTVNYRSLKTQANWNSWRRNGKMEIYI